MALEFVQDAPRPIGRSARVTEGVSIDGVVIERLEPNADGRGRLIELITTRDGLAEPIVHVYQVVAEAGSRRGWVYHKWQFDRLAFTLGRFEIHLVDIRDGSPTRGARMVIEAGEANPIRLRIPPHVAHAVINTGPTTCFINMPTQVYDPDNPDKFRYSGDLDDLATVPAA
ncbi:dTDP-4-dehydrorhamnose 3,5-epimerase family protein [Prosthecodimorpha staleyi]|uniref:dTDP-4-dehydrorhamnose 3,5-epimerase n=1 Tax=Prosthecodimorpha staleyi TaxID=2840188 RepID=A0A947D6W3_9HYPH|nr:dTDP-4-dehydrorhamnose 3,5-epimerase family protein [Prosthecodimorpha staleyi]MBT9291443.1 dTDP-4-dehydrorhamnose 3,5-epimerase family protein [Prosthecodimorpha staleyi]